MPFKTFRRSRTPGQRRRHDAAIVAQGTNQRMFIQERERLLSGGLSLDKLAQGAEAIGLMRKCRFTGFFQGFTGVTFRQAEQPLEHADPLDAPVLKHGGRPVGGPWTNRTRFRQQPGRAPLNAADLLRGEVFSLSAEPSWIIPDVQGHLLHPAVKDPHQAAVPADPELGLTAQRLGQKDRAKWLAVTHRATLRGSRRGCA